MAFNGTLVVAGQGKGVVVATAGATQIGRISGMLAEVETLTSPLLRQMSLFAQWITLLILLCAGLLLVYGYFVQHQDFEELFMIVVGLSVAAIPEGLPATLTITLAVGVQTMARRHAIVRRLPAIETLGALTVICTDKTGTLTRNEMMAATTVTAGGTYNVNGTGYDPEGLVTQGDVPKVVSDHPVLSNLLRTAILCNDSNLIETGSDWTVQGDPMEGALLVMAQKALINRKDVREAWQRLDSIPFDAGHRYIASLDKSSDHENLIAVKGAPEQLLDICNSQSDAEGNVSALEAAFWQEQIALVASKGQRVLAFAHKLVPKTKQSLAAEDLSDELVFLGLVGLIDPPRPEAVAAVAECRSAGIKVKMITGDHAATASAIAALVGLDNSQNVLTGGEIEALDDAMLTQEVKLTNVFARTSPEHKLRLVIALQSTGEIVGMTGDGVNDAPALKRADAGIAMGRKGSEATKEAADLVLSDDKFTSIAAAVREGRTVYDNLKKVIGWTLPTSGGEAAAIIAALLIGVTLPISAVQILWVNLITAGTLGIALAFERSEDDTMNRPPRPLNEPIISKGLAWHIVLVSFLFLCGVYRIFNYAMDRGYSIEMARTLCVNTRVVMEIFHLFIIRNIYSTSLTWEAIRGTKVIWICVTVVALGQFAFTYLPPFHCYSIRVRFQLLTA